MVCVKMQEHWWLIALLLTFTKCVINKSPQILNPQRAIFISQYWQISTKRLSLPTPHSAVIFLNYSTIILMSQCFMIDFDCFDNGASWKQISTNIKYTKNYGYFTEIFNIPQTLNPLKTNIYPVTNSAMIFFKCPLQ